MEIKYFGYDIFYGKYFLHSKFKSVYNYTDNNSIVSIVNSEIGKGPNNIVIDDFPDKAEKEVIITSKKLIIGRESFKIDKSKNDAKIYLRNKDQLKNVIELILNNINFEGKSLGFILFPEEEKYFKSTFEIAFVRKIKEILNDFTFENLPTVAKNMKGLGFGLTPSGDDFNCGVLYALHYLKNISNIDSTETIYRYFSNAIGNNLISNTFIMQAYKNNYYKNFQNLLIALDDGEDEKIIYYRDEVLASGHSSGSDMLAGFIFCLNSFYQGGLND